MKMRGMWLVVIMMFVLSLSVANAFAASKKRWYKDQDGDGYGNASVWIDRVTQPRGYVANSADCDDNSAAAYPGAAEVWDDGIDQNCDGHDSVTFTSVFGWNAEGGVAVQQTSDGGYIVLGTEPYLGTNTFFYTKLSRAGVVEWSRHYETGYHSYGRSIRQTSDGGYVMAGYASTQLNGSEALVIKTDSLGVVQWVRSLGDPNFYYYAEFVYQTQDGGYAIAGHTTSIDRSVVQTYLARLDSAGSLLWISTYENSYARGMDLLSDGGFVLLGTRNGNMSLLRVDAVGNVVWSGEYPYSGYAWGTSVRQTSDGGYAIFGNGYEPVSASYDYILIKTDATGAVQWSQAYGHSGFHDEGYGFDLTGDGGFIMSGYTFVNSNYPDILLIRADAVGNELWKKVFPSDPDRTDMSFGVCSTDDGGFALSGRTTSDLTYGAVGTLVIKTDQDGGVNP